MASKTQLKSGSGYCDIRFAEYHQVHVEYEGWNRIQLAERRTRVGAFQQARRRLLSLIKEIDKRCPEAAPAAKDGEPSGMDYDIPHY